MGFRMWSWLAIFVPPELPVRGAAGHPWLDAYSGRKSRASRDHTTEDTPIPRLSPLTCGCQSDAHMMVRPWTPRSVAGTLRRHSTKLRNGVFSTCAELGAAKSTDLFVRQVWADPSAIRCPRSSE